MIDHLALWIGYGVMAGGAALVVGTVICFGVQKLFWHTPGEVCAFLKFMAWKAKGKPEAPKEQS